MMVKDIPYVAGSFSVGDVIKIPKRISEQNIEKVSVEIISKYPYFALVREIKQDLRPEDRLRWSIQWKDFVRLEIRK